MRRIHIEEMRGHLHVLRIGRLKYQGAANAKHPLALVDKLDQHLERQVLGDVQTGDRP
jgi:hypothetical protein